MSVRRAQAEIDSLEFAEWMEDYKARPWGRDEDERAAMICREIVNWSWCRPKPAARLSDFLPQPAGAPKTRQTVAEAKANWQRAAANWPKPKQGKRGR